MLFAPILPEESSGEVRCPNCGKMLPLCKKDSGLGNTMGGFDIYMIILVPTMVAALFLAAYILGCKRINVAWDVGSAIVVVLFPLVSLLLILISRYLRDEEKRRKEFGYQVWMVSCECGNCFRIVRSTTMLPAEPMEGDPVDAEYEQEE